MSFESLKKRAMLSLQNAKISKEVDKEAVPLLDILNKKKNFFTSSSCYGRIYLINLPTNEKKADAFVVKWHRKVKFSEVKKALDNNKGKIWFKMEPLILHISCKSLKDAEKILDIKQKLGIKRGGIFNINENRIQIELEGTQKLDTLVKDKTHQVDDEYLKVLISEANKRFMKNAQTWEMLKKEFSILK